MAIKHIGSTILKSSSSPFTFKLTNLLYVPKITKDLLNVSQFARDYHVYFQFYPNYCVVKSQDSQEVVLQGKLKNGLYQFDNLTTSITSVPRTIPHAFYSQCSIFYLWHKRLGHLENKIVFLILNNCNVSIPSNKDTSTSSICESCYLGKIHQLPYFTSTTTYAPLDLIFFLCMMTCFSS